MGADGEGVGARWWLRRAVGAACALLAALAPAAALVTVPAASAAFTGTTASAGNAWTAAAAFPSYPASVAAQTPWAYHRAEEAPSSAASSTAADSSGNARTATYHSTTNGPSTWWALDDAAGSTAADASGAANPATLVGAATWTSGTAGSAVSLDGSTGYGSARRAVRTDASFSVAAWAKLSALPATQAAVVSQSGTHTYGFQLGVDKSVAAGGSGKWTISMTSSDAASPATVKIQYSKNAAVAGVWTHLVGVYDASLTKLYLYVDGTSTGNATWTSPWGSTGGLQLGRSLAGDAYGQYFPGAIDDVRAYGRALSAAEAVNLAGTQLATSYDFSEGSGATTADAGYVGNTASLGSTGWTASGHPGNALSLGGAADCATGSGASLQTNLSYSVSAWVYLTAKGTNRTVVSQDGTSISGFFLQYELPTDRWAFVIRTSDSTASTLYEVLGTSSPSLNTWYHLVGVYDAAAGTIALYVDGALVSSTAPGAVWNAPGALRVGCGKWNGALTDWWPGRIDGVRLYQRALTAADVAALFADTDPTVTVTEAGLTAGVFGALQGAQQGQQSSTAVAFSGRANVSNGTSVTDPSPFTVECWFRASGSSGGAIVGLGASRTGMAAENTDRLVYLNDTGHVVFRVNPGTPTSLTSPGTYEDGGWHHLAASTGPAGTMLYLDGSLVASAPGVTSAQNMTGYWRWGGSPLVGLADRPAGDYLVGSLDEMAVYGAQLSGVQVARHAHADH